jgi:hypothetical protein
MKLPDVLTVVIQDLMNKNPVEKIAIWIRLFAERKSDYYVPGVTNKDGKIYISKLFVNKVIEDSMDSALMDYASSLEECKDKIEIEIISVEGLHKSLKSMKVWVGISKIITDELVYAFENSNNHLYKPKKMIIQVNEKMSEVVVEIEKN